MAVVRSLHQIAALTRSRRLELGQTQGALAERAGVSRWWVNEFESGRSRAELGLVLALLEALELDIEIAPAPRGPAPGDTARSAPDAVDLDEHLDRYGDE